MALNKPRVQFGFHQMTAVNRVNGLPYGTIKVLANYSATNEREQVDLFGGSNPSAWDSEAGKLNSDLSLTIKEFKPFLYTLAGYTVTTNVAETYGSITGSSGTGSTGVVVMTNIKGTSVQHAVTGLASVEIGTVANLKDGVYVVTATSGACLDIFCVNDVNFTKGTDITYATDLLKIAASTGITTGTLTHVDIGIQFTIGSAIGMTVGDTATFEVRSANEASYSYILGDNPTPVEFGMYLISQKKSNGEFIYEYYPRTKFSSVPSGMDMAVWKEDITLPMKVMYDSSLGYTKKRMDLVTDLN